ncbi:hypothetical protein GGS20DRAFT_24563 [Poronia punctata]|nr:hypothetical protein GGS20DRAFT_24563 [Poronia punctata]
MYSPSLLATLFLTAITTSTAAAAPTDNDFPSYSISVFAPGTTVHGAQLNAGDAGFYTGLTGPMTSCPMEPEECPPVEGTLVSPLMGGMKVVVPGGQSIFVQVDGQVKYSIPHSAYIPPGALVGRFYTKKVQYQSSKCKAPRESDVLDFSDGAGHGGLTLCPDIPDEMAGTGASFVLYAKTAGFNLTDCSDIKGLTMTKSDANFGCFQYS